MNKIPEKRKKYVIKFQRKNRKELKIYRQNKRKSKGKIIRNA